MTIALNSERWTTLTHAYGSAADIPQLLSDLDGARYSEAFEAEPWFSLWSALCHQFGVGTASYASVPHLVAAAQKAADPRVRLRICELAYAIECYRHRPSSPPMPVDVDVGYAESVTELFRVLRQLLDNEWNENDFASILAGLAVARGFWALGGGISELSDEVECQACGAFFAPPGYDLFKDE